MRRLHLLLCVVAVSASWSRATVVWNETANGDLSNNQAAPTPLTLASGTNSVVGTTAAGDQDWLALTIPAGFQLSSDVLESYASTDSQGFTGVQAGSSFVGNPETTPSAYLGYAHYGTAASNGAAGTLNLVGDNLLPIMGNTADAAGSQGFTPPLGAGTYTFLIQQTGATTAYQFDFGVTSVPEPGSLCVVGLTATMALRRRTGR